MIHDFLGNEINVDDDIVVISATDGQHYLKGRVQRLTQSSVSILVTDCPKRPNYVGKTKNNSHEHLMFNLTAYFWDKVDSMPNLQQAIGV